jgi:hypothetical protein
MKVLIVVCALVLLLQIGALGLSFGTGDIDPRTKDRIKSGEQPPDKEFPLAARFENFLDRFRPRLDLSWETQSFPSGSTQTIAFRNGGKGSDGQRVAKFELASGTGARIGYACRIDKPGYNCPQSICLCQPGEPLDALTRAACMSLPPVCPADGNVGKIVVYGETGTLEFSGLGAAGGTVRQP